MRFSKEYNIFQTFSICSLTTTMLLNMQQSFGFFFLMASLFNLVISMDSKACYSSDNMHCLYWNTSNPMFSATASSENVIDINSGNHPWEYDQMNIVCPSYDMGEVPVNKQEKYIIYSVSEQEYESCRITQPNPKIVALCDSPSERIITTITFRSFTPTPGGMEFRPGQNYYFISTSSRNDLLRPVGGGCSTNNMKVRFRVAHVTNEVEDNNEVLRAANGESQPSFHPFPKGMPFPWSQERDYKQIISTRYYHGQKQEERRPKNSVTDSNNEDSYNSIRREASAVMQHSSSSAILWTSNLSRVTYALVLTFLLARQVR